MTQCHSKNKRSLSFSFEQIKPKLADENPETTIAAWFKVTHPNVPSLTDNFKSEDSLDSYLGLVDDFPSPKPDFLVDRPCQQRHARPTHHPTSHLDQRERQPLRNVTYRQPKYVNQTRYHYPAVQGVQACMHAKESRDGDFLHYHPSTVDEISTIPQSTPTSKSNGWVTYEYDREKSKQRFANNYHNNSMHSERVSMFYKRDPTWDFPKMYNSH